jgi:branched-chain amino acid transport system permease protein
MNRNTTILLNFVLVACLGLFLWWAEGSLDGYKIQILNLIAVNIILALSLNLIYGFTGMFSLGHAGFMAIGAYVCSILIMTPDQKATLFILQAAFPLVENAHAPFLVAVIAGGLVAAFSALSSVRRCCVWETTIWASRPWVLRRSCASSATTSLA